MLFLLAINFGWICFNSLSAYMWACSVENFFVLAIWSVLEWLVSDYRVRLEVFLYGGV